VQRLEEALGAPVFDRTRRPVALTDVGRAALGNCRRVLSTVAELQAVGTAHPRTPLDVGLGVAHALSELALLGPLETVRTNWPHVQWRLTTGWSRHLVAAVTTGQIDAAVLLWPEGRGWPAGIEGVRLADEELVVIGPSAMRRTQDLATLAKSPWILSPEGCAGRHLLQQAFARRGKALRLGLETFNYEVQMALVARGRGLGLVPSRLLARSRVRDRLATADVAGARFPFGIWLVAGDRTAVAAPLAALRKALIDDLARESPRPRTADRRTTAYRRRRSSPGVHVG
jgi:DNA-binding transcriptional LysR family regulator